MKLLLLLVAVLLASALLAHLAVNQPGYLLFSYGRTSVELPLVDFLVVMLLVLTALYLLLRLLGKAWGSPREVRAFSARRRCARARKTFLKGLIEMAEGRWARAEKLLVGSAPGSDVPVLNYLAAAHVAQRQHAPERRDEYLRAASAADPKARIAVGLAQAELQARQGQNEEALATLRLLGELDRKHPLIRKQLARIFYRLKDWNNLRDLLPELRKRSILEPAELARIEADVLAALMAQFVRQGDKDELNKLWKQLSRAQRNHPSLIRQYAQALADLNQHADAERVLRTALNQQWNEALLLAYGELKHPVPHESLRYVDTWMREQPRTPELLAAAGRVNAQAALWGKARSLLRESLQAKPLPSTFEALAQLHERLQEHSEAETIYKEGFQYLASRLRNRGFEPDVVDESGASGLSSR
ncbi:MAG: heme biosynthesis HemY N-terminal domain-containing protein [Thiotrichales bacterium]